MVVYTPSVLDNGIYMANLTLAPGYFWSDVIEPPGQHIYDQNQMISLVMGKNNV